MAMINVNAFVNESPKQWEEGRAKTITFILTEDCQLRCKYCYIIGKNSNKRMPFVIAQKAIDYILSDKTISAEKSVIFDFIGGEPFLEIELIDKISDYIKVRLYETGHPWFNSYRFSFSTNGLLYDHEKVQKYISKNKTHISIGISIDGSKQKHDLQRIFPDGKGSYDDVVRNIPLWLKQFPESSTKVTVASDDIPYINESVIHLWKLGIKEININVVFEDVWKDHDDILFENQLVQLADYIIENKLYNEQISCSFFSNSIGKPLFDNQNWCGAGFMLAVDADGNFYPCLRFAGYSLQNKKPVIIGNCLTGIDHNKLRPFLTLDRITQSPQECIDCEVASGCAWCQGANYDFAETGTIFQRTTYICKMHKARVRANNYFWDKLKQVNDDEKN
jgi:uncharacterized protein